MLFFQYKIVAKIGPEGSPQRRVRDDDFIVGSDCVRNVFESSCYWRKEFRVSALKSWPQNFVAGAVLGEFWRFICDADHWWGWSWIVAPRIGNDVSYVMRIIGAFILCGRCSIWWGWRVTLLAPRIGSDVSYVTQIIDDIHFAWQAQYLVRLEGDFTCSTHWKWGFICDADHWWHSFCVAGAVFGEVGGWLYLLHALEMRFHMWRRSLMTLILRGRRSIWWSWTVPFVAPRIVHDVSK